MKEYRKFRKRNQAEKKEKRHLALAFLVCAAMLFTGGCTSENVPEETEDDTAKLTVVGFSEGRRGVRLARGEYGIDESHVY